MQDNPFHFKLLKQKVVELNKGCRCARMPKLMAGTGLSRDYIYKILNGQRFDQGAVFKVADFLGVPREALVKKTKRRA